MEPSRTTRLTAWLLLAVALLFSSGVRWRLLDFPLERDEGEYAYAGQLILHGVPPYQAAYNMKLPGVYLAYAGGMAVFGQTVSGVHLTLIVANLAAIALVFFLAKDLFDPLAGGFSALVYSLLALGPSVLGMAAHATHFVALFGVAGAWALWRAISSDRKSLMAASGLLLGIAFLMKQQGVFLIAFGGLAVVIHDLARRPRGWRKLSADLPLFVLGAILPYALTCLWLWHAGVFGRFWFWTVDYARQYVQQVSSAEEAWMYFRGTFFDSMVASCWPLWVAATAGLFTVGIAKGDRKAKWFAYGFFVFAFLCVCPGFLFRAHYFIAWLPAVAIFAGAACSQMILFSLRPPKTADSHRSESARKQKTADGRREKSAVAETVPAPFYGLLWAVVFVLVVGFGIVINGSKDFFFFIPPKLLCQYTYFPNPFVESQEIADFIRSHTTPDQTIAVLGSEPQLYFLSQRRSATGYIYTYALMERQDFALKMQQEMAKEIEQSKPEFVVYVGFSLRFSWLWRPNSQFYIFEWCERFLQSDYRPVGLVVIAARDKPAIFIWGDQAAGIWDTQAAKLRLKPQAVPLVWIFQRKNAR